MTVFAIQLKDGSLEHWCGAPIIFGSKKDVWAFRKGVPLYYGSQIVQLEITVRNPK